MTPRPTVPAAALALLLTMSMLVVAPASPSAAAPTWFPSPPTLPHPDAHGITTVGGKLTRPLLQRPGIWDAEMRTDAIMVPRGPTTPADVSIPVKVRFFIPDDYDPDRAEPYDVLYLLQSGAGTAEDWSTSGRLVDTLAQAERRVEGIVVMPEGGRSGWYSDWPGRTDGNSAPQSETFHIDQLVPW